MSKRRNIITWSLSVLLALMFVAAGYTKISGQEMTVQSFGLFGLPGWFRVAIGTLEVVGGLLLLVPALAGMAAFGLSVIMIGAIATHVMYTPLFEAIPATIAFLALTYIYLTRKAVIPRFLQKLLIG